MACSFHTVAAFLLVATIMIAYDAAAERIVIYRDSVFVDGKARDIVVHAGEEPADAARKFCKAHRVTDKDAEEKLVDHLCFSTYLRCRRDHAQDSIVSAQVKWRDDESKKVFQLDFDLGKGEKDTVERAVFSACRPLVGKFNGCPRKVFSTLLAYVKEKLELKKQ